MSNDLPEPDQTSSKEPSPFVLFGCLLLFGLPFFSVGLGAVAVATGLWAPQNAGTSEAWMLGWFGVVFAGAGLIIFGLATFVFRSAREKEALRTEHPVSPWMWRKDWATGRIPDHTGSRAAGGLIFSLLWNVFVIPIFVLVLRKGEELPVVLFLGFFVLIGLAIFAGSVYGLLQRRKFRRSYFAMTTFPGRVGQSLRGAIETAMTFDSPMTDGSFVVKVLCVNRITTRSGKSSSTHEETKWEAESRVPFTSCQPGPWGGSMIPVRFDIPDDAPRSNDDNPRDAIVWKLQANAELPGIDYQAEWEVPVF